MNNITVRQAINEIQEMYSRGAKSKDSRLSSRYIYSVLIKNRATVLEQKINRKQSISQWSYQPLRCVELEQISQNYSDNTLLKTKHKLPLPILGMSSGVFENVTTIDSNIKFDPTTFENFKYSKGKKYTANKPSFYIRDQYLYINYITKLKGISLSGLFNDPIEATKFPSLCSDCPGCECKDAMDFDFPLDSNTLNSVIKLASNELILLFSQMKEDKNNNASDDNQYNNQMVHQPQQTEPVDQ